MRGQLIPALAVVLFLETLAWSQIGTPYPGGYPPGGGYPGGRGGIGGGFPPIPRPRRKSKDTPRDPKGAKDKKEAQEPLQEVTGVLRKLDEASVVVEAQDTRIINLKRTEKTTFTKAGKPIQPADLKPGDHLLAEAKQDEQGFLYAVNVILQKEGTAEERAAASRPLDILTPQPQDSDDDRPVLRKKGPARSEDTTAQPPQAAPAPREEAEESRPAPRPQIRDLPAEDDEPAPVLRRRKPGERTVPSAPAARKKEPPPVETASAAPPPAREPEPVREVVVVENPAAPPDPIIEKARELAASFTQSLPNYYCKQLITRYINTSHKISWQAQDVVSANVIYENGRERYRDIAINGKPAKKSMEELPGAWSTGEFGTVLADLFSPGTAADFVRTKQDQAGGRAAWIYEFTVERENSHWRIYAASQSFVPAYKGGVWIDAKTRQVLRIEMEARGLPREFPFDKVESAVDYQYVTLGGTQQFLLPVHAENLICQNGTNVCSRNVIEFRNYHKYTSESEIVFDPK